MSAKPIWNLQCAQMVMRNYGKTKHKRRWKKQGHNVW
jgi:hypothetical protein